MSITQKLLASVVVFSACLTALASPTNPESGKEYLLLERPQQTDMQGKVEVLEFFFYTCPHCHMLEPYLSAWVKKQGNEIAFKRIPVDFGPGLKELRKMYYTLEAMGKLEALHGKVFQAIHVERQPLNTEKQVLEFVKKNGVKEKDYLDMSNSFGVATQINRAQALQTAYQINSVPTLVVAGRFMTSPSQVMSINPKMTEAQSEQALMQVLDALVVKAAKK